MTDEELLAKLLETAFTKGELLRRLSLVRQYLEHRFFSPVRAHRSVDAYVFFRDQKVSQADIDAIEKLGQDFFDSFSRDTLYTLLNILTEKINTIEKITVYLPFTFPDKETVRLGTWFRENVDKKAILEIHSDPTLIGGCAFVINGVYRDYSLRHFILKNKEEIVDILNRYSRDDKPPVSPPPQNIDAKDAVVHEATKSEEIIDKKIQSS